MVSTQEGTIVTEFVALYIVNCGPCGGTYALNKRYVAQKREKGGYWHCPYCQTSWGYGESENERLKAALEKQKKSTQWQADRARKAEEDAEHRRRQYVGMKGVLTKQKNRVSKGVCPCCNRYFKNLHRHMESKHPKFTKAPK